MHAVDMLLSFSLCSLSFSFLSLFSLFLFLSLSLLFSPHQEGVAPASFPKEGKMYEHEMQYTAHKEAGQIEKQDAMQVSE